MNDSLDALELQRLLDGRMSADERTLFCEIVDETDDGWKSVALAFVEEQALRAGLSPTAAPLQSPPAAPGGSRGMIARLMTTLAFTACALVAGLFIGRATVADGGGDPTITNRKPPANPSTAGRPKNDYYIVLAPDEKKTPENAATAPADPLDSMMRPVIDPGTRQLVRDHGYRIQEEPVIYVYYDEKGDSYVIPQRHVSFHPEKR